MGYILPVTQYEYIQYANRTVTVEKQPQKLVQGVQPIRPVTFMQELEKETGNVERDKPLQPSQLTEAIPAYLSRQSLKSKVPEHIITQTAYALTGKGGYFNEKI
jgi:hypothetical protein